MPFAYYRNLTATQRAVYRRSDALARVTLTDATAARGWVHDLERALATEDRYAVEDVCAGLLDELAAQLGVPRVRVSVLAVRPSADWGELHGLYERCGQTGRAKITLWLRTVQRRQIVAFRTFLRTLLHELCHHLDFELYGLADSFHTQGFFKRESSLMRQLAPRRPRGSAR